MSMTEKESREALISAIVKACGMMSVERLRMLFITATMWSESQDVKHREG